MLETNLDYLLAELDCHDPKIGTVKLAEPPSDFCFLACESAEGKFLKSKLVGDNWGTCVEGPKDHRGRN